MALSWDNPCGVDEYGGGARENVVKFIDITVKEVFTPMPLRTVTFERQQRINGKNAPILPCNVISDTETAFLSTSALHEHEFPNCHPPRPGLFSAICRRTKEAEKVLTQPARVFNLPPPSKY